MTGDRGSVRRRAIFWLAILPVAWLIAAFVAASREAMTIRPDGSIGLTPWSDRLAANLALYGIWMLLTPGAVLLVRRITSARAEVPAAILAHLGAAALFVALDFAAHVLLPGLSFNLPPTWDGLRSMLPPSIGVYCVIAFATIAWTLHQRAISHEQASIRLETQLVQARLDLLRAQLHPHFLFNALHAISALVDVRPQEARTMLARLSELLRQAVDFSHTAEVPLTREIEWIEQYVELQQVRYDDRLEVDIAVAAEATTALVPPLVLQPLVENAIKHGIEMQRDHGRITISAEREGVTLVLRVHDDGPGIQYEPRDGIGLRNTRDRLQALYGAAAFVDLRESADGGADAVVTIPFREA